MAYVTELVELFARTVMYYNQRLKHGVSYSALYEVSEENMLSDFAGVVDDARVIHAIVRLKERYFQIQRHIIEASKLATEFSVQGAKYEILLGQYGSKDERVKEAQDRSQEAIIRAKHAQSRALAFFEFEEMINWTKIIIDYAKREINSADVYRLEKFFYQRIKEKYEADLEQQKKVPQNGLDPSAAT